MLAGTKIDPLHRPFVRQQGFTPNRENWSLFSVGKELFVNYWAKPQIVMPINPTDWKLGEPTVVPWNCSPQAEASELHFSSQRVLL